MGTQRGAGAARRAVSSPLRRVCDGRGCSGRREVAQGGRGAHWAGEWRRVVVGTEPSSLLFWAAERKEPASKAIAAFCLRERGWGRRGGSDRVRDVLQVSGGARLSERERHLRVQYVRE